MGLSGSGRVSARPPAKVNAVVRIGGGTQILRVTALNSARDLSFLRTMTDDDLIHVIWTVWPLIERFEAAPYSLSAAELGTLNDYERQKQHRKNANGGR